MEAVETWKKFVDCLSPPSILTPEQKTHCKDLVEELQRLKFPIQKCIGSWYRIKFRHYFKNSLYGGIIEILQQQDNDFVVFERIITFLGKNVLQYLINFHTVEEIDSTFSKQLIYQDILVIILENQRVTEVFESSCVKLYKIGFDAYEKSQNCEDLSAKERQENEDRLKNFNKINQYMCCLHLFEDIAYDAVLHVLNSQIREFIIQNFQGQSFETSVIYPTFSWLETSVIPYIQTLTHHFVCPPNISLWKKRLKYLCYKTISEIRIADLFEILVDYPDSHAAVLDLKKCLSYIQCSTSLIHSLQVAFKERLLNPGVNTDDIITQYASAIKVLKFLDPTGVTLQKVCLPLRTYLKEREDTIKCILISLVSKEANELIRGLTETSGNLFKGNEDSDLEDDDWMNWVPPSKEITLDTRVGAGAQDTITTLCSIYGNADVFISEYRNLIADKLLTTNSYDLKYEMQNLELLKSGFGDDLSKCKIMLQDISDSYRTHNLIMNKLTSKPPFQLSVLMISHVFWPNLRADEIEVYKPLQEFLEGEYQQRYSEVKQSRTLEWKYNLGFVELELEIEGKTLPFTVSPVQATIISLFEDEEKHNADDIANAIGLPLVQTRKKLAFWVTNGILSETSHDVYELRKGDDITPLKSGVMVMEDMDSAMVKIKEVREEELEGATTFVIGLIKTSKTGDVTLERVHKLLAMLLSDSVAGQLTVEEVKKFLDKKVKQNMLVFSGGVYKKAKA